MRLKTWLGVAFMGLAALAGTDAERNQPLVGLSMGGRVLLPCVDSELVVAGATPPWTWVWGKGDIRREADGSQKFTVEPTGAPGVDGVCRLAPGEADGVKMSWSFTPRADACYRMLGVTATFPFPQWKGGAVIPDGERIDVPAGREPMTVFSRSLSSLELTDGTGRRRLAWKFPSPTRVVFQNNRQWTDTFSIRILLPDCEHLKAGRTETISFTLFGAGSYSEEAMKPLTLQAGPDWIPLAAKPWIVAGSALDLSAARGTDAPAGRWGRVVARGQNFEFERAPGVPRRFYGMNLCVDANAPGYEEARRWAQNMARIGYNAVRFHHHEATLVWGAKDPGRTELNAEAMKRFDGLVAACIEAGLYMTTDLYVSRTSAGIPWRGVGIDRDGNMQMDDVKILAPVDAGVFANLADWTRNFLNHVNAYTGRRLADEPALAWISLVNEGNLDKFGIDAFRDWPAWRTAWTEWIAARKAAEPAVYGKVPDRFPERIDGVWMKFIQDVEARFIARAKTLLREELKCGALVTDMNDGWMNSIGFAQPRSESCDYVDCHFYVDHPRFLEKSWRLPSECPNANPLCGERMGTRSCSGTRLLNRPFTITEYNYSGPGRFRGVGGIVTGAQAALQNWAGLWRFAWSHGRQGIAEPEKKAMGYFDISGDPLSLAAERASVCLFLRRDLPELRQTYAVAFPPKAFARPDDGLTALTQWDWTAAGWYAKIGSVYAETVPEGARCAGTFPSILRKTVEEVRADLRGLRIGDGAVDVDPERGTFLLSTPRTCGGFAEGGRIRTSFLEADLGKTAATLWASAVEEKPLAEADRILVTHLTDVQNTGISYLDASRRVLLDFGGLPHLMRAGTARVSLAVHPGTWTVWAVETDGTRRAKVPSAFAGDRLTFTADVARDPAQATFLYEVVCEESRPLKVLMIGNSFSICCLEEMPAVARAMGRKLDLCSLYIGGCSLERHWKNVCAPETAPYLLTWNYGGVPNAPTAPVAACVKIVEKKTHCNIPEALKADRWDVVTLQQASHFSWQPETYHPFGDELVKTIRRLAPQAKIMVQETWSYTPWDGRFAKWGFGAEAMYEKLHAAYASFAEPYGFEVIPMGAAVQAWRRSLPVVYAENSFGGDVCGSARFEQVDGKWRPKGDVFHLNREGNYLQGLVWTAKLFGVDVTTCPYAPKHLSAEKAALMKRVAMEAVTGVKSCP